jgi:hypothetical protein
MNDHANPFAELTRMVERFKVRGVDVAALIETGRKDFEALIEANKAVFQGMQALAHKQAEVLSQAMQKIQEVTHRSGNGATADQAHTAYRGALGEMKEMAEIVRRSQAEALVKVADRAIAHLQELKKMLETRTRS